MPASRCVDVLAHAALPPVDDGKEGSRTPGKRDHVKTVRAQGRRVTTAGQRNLEGGGAVGCEPGETVGTVKGGARAQEQGWGCRLGR